MTDPFDDFAREMNRRTRQAIQGVAAQRTKGPRLSEQDQRDRAVVSAMKDMPLQRGQMLLLGPRSVAMLSGTTPYDGTLPDKLVLERNEWAT